MNPYEILGVEYGASAEEIQKAFRKKALEHHPDRGGDVEIFKKVTNAYAMLKKGEAPLPAMPMRQQANVVIIYGPNGPMIRIINTPPPQAGGGTTGFSWNTWNF